VIAHHGVVSVPSSHATVAFALALAIGAFLDRRWGLALGVLVLVANLSRVWVGVHGPGDTLAAAVIAALAVLEVALWSLWLPLTLRTYHPADPRGDRPPAGERAAPVLRARS
jgi:membrane-associated phospholipid phosphatase